MNTQPMNQNNPQANLELKIRTMRMVWISMLFSLGGFFVITFVQKPSEDRTPNPSLSLIFLLVGVSTTLISFLIRSKLLSRAVDQQKVEMVQQAYIVGWAVNEATALLGVIDFFHDWSSSLLSPPPYLSPRTVASVPTTRASRERGI